MTGEGALRALAARFWQEAGGPAPLPRDVARAALYVLPISIVYPARLSVGVVRAWLAARGIAVPLAGPDRLLRGCLVAHRGAALLLVDGQDPPEEQRFTVAHEVAHFLLEHQGPRERARRRLGPGALEVLDGLRGSTVGEQVDALLADVALRVRTHLLDRSPSGGPACGTALRAECRADRLALELLAPAPEVWTRLGNAPLRPFEALVARAADLLMETFGLPGAIATAYARHLALARTGGPSVREWLGLP